LPNVYLYHYANLRRDLGLYVAQITFVLGYDCSKDVLDRIVDGASFGTMQANAKSVAIPGKSETFIDEAAFF
jgi:aryl sulfotransferase